MKRHLFPVQLALPLGYSESALGALPQSPAPSKRRRSRSLQARLEANLAMLARLDTVPGSLNEDSNYFHCDQRFSLTLSLSSLINEVNVKRWSHIAALPHIGKGEVAKFSESRPFVGRGSLSDLQAGPLVRWSATDGAPVCPRCECVAVYTYTYTTRKLFKCKACNHQYSVTS
jgi:Transposase zinc-ribbon domain